MLLILLNIIGWLEEHQLPCLFKTAFHFDCPGCGMQRSCIALLRGDILQSLKFYPALIPVIFFFIFLMLDDKFSTFNSFKITKIWIASIFIIILVSYFYKFTF
ncbi:DUF2752 domain-containing protein [Ferruginibacter sp.]